MTKFLLKRKGIILIVLLMHHVCIAQTVALMGPIKASHSAQTGTLSSAKLKDVILELGRRYQVSIVYEESTIQGFFVTAEEQNLGGDLGKQLTALLKPRQLEYKRSGKGTYLILKKDDKQTGKHVAIPDTRKTTDGIAEVSADIQVSGRVIDEKREGLPGVNVILKGTQRGTSTDAEGNFKLTVPDQTSNGGPVILAFSFVGFMPQEVTVGSQTTINVTLQSDTKALDEVVVVGYGEQKKINVTGSVVTLSAKSIESTPVSNISSGLVGRLPGLTAINRGGLPGDDAPQISIRGFGNMLIIVDGVQNDFNNIDPNEIDNVSILKDASAAIYGARAGNGVVLITTKRGKSGAPNISFNTYYGVQAPTRIAKQVDAPTYAQMMNDAEVAAGRSAKYTAAEIQKFREGTDPAYPNTNWYKEVIKKSAPIALYNLNTSGGSDRIKYFLSLGYLNQGGLLKTGDIKYNRYNIRSNIDAKISNNFSVSLDLSARMEQRDQPGGTIQQILEDLTFSQPTFAPHYPDPAKIAYTGHLATQPLARADKNIAGYLSDNRRFFTGIVTFKYDFPFLKGLSAKALFNANTHNGYTKRFGKQFFISSYNPADQTYSSMGVGQNSKDQLDEGQKRSTNLTSQYNLNYSGSWGKHEFGAILIGEFTKNDSSYFNAHREGYITTSVDQLFAGSDLNKDNNGSASTYGRTGYAGRVNYAYAGKYLAEASVRYDASSRYSSSTRWGYFPSISLGWRLSEESFMKNIDAIDFLKLRASYGKAGNDYVGQYNYLTGYVFSGNNVFGETPVIDKGLVSKGLANPDLTWEKTSTSNIGLDGSLWKRLLSFDLDLFYRKVLNVPGYRTNSLPSTFGAVLPQENINSFDNRGFELVLKHERTIRDINYNIDFNVTYSRSKWIHYDEPVYQDDETRERLQLSGQWQNRFFGYQALGLFQSQEEINSWTVIQDENNNKTLRPGDIKYADYNGDGVLDYKDSHVIGRGFIPNVFFGLNAGLRYKGFDFSMLWQGAANYNAYFSGLVTNPFQNGNVPFSYLTDYWTPENTDAKYPRLYPGGASNNKFASTFWLQDASYVRLKTIQVGYSVPKQLISKIGVPSLRVYVSAYNILTFDKVSPFDPETGSTSNGQFYPQQKSVNVGFNLNF